MLHSETEIKHRKMLFAVVKILRLKSNFNGCKSNCKCEKYDSE